MQTIRDDKMADLFLTQLRLMMFRIYTYEALMDNRDAPFASAIRGVNGVSVVNISQEMIGDLKLAAWERFDALIALGGMETAQQAIEACRKIIDGAKGIPASQVDSSLRI
jgi:hypothetical protein